MICLPNRFLAHFNTLVYLLTIPIILCLGNIAHPCRYHLHLTGGVALAILGCVSDSPGIPEIYLVSLQTGDKIARIRYYGRSVQQVSMPVES